MKNKKSASKGKKVEKNNKWLKYVGIVLIIVLFFFILYFVLHKNSYSVVMIDVNPSIELTLNSDDRIVDYEANDSESEMIISGMDLENTDVVVALNAIIGSMIRNGYIDELSNSILVSVQNSDINKALSLENLLVKEIDDILKDSNIDGSVIGLTLSSSDSLNGVAEANGISLGKAKLITALVQANNLLNISDLAKLTINELNLLLDTYTLDVDKLGSASSKQYIGEDEAKNIALTHADVSNPTMLHIEFDLDAGVMVYDVEFYSDNVEYDYEINAVTGTILEYNKGFESEYGDNTVNSGGNSYISKEKAKQIAIDHAGVNPTYVEVEFDYENGIAVYEIEFKYQNYEYDYEIDAVSGEIYKSKKEYDYDVNPNR